jgi:uncharacterized membrane protein YagU involved in acid resistance
MVCFVHQLFLLYFVVSVYWSKFKLFTGIRAGDIYFVMACRALFPFAAGTVGGFYLFATVFAMKYYRHFVTLDETFGY